MSSSPTAALSRRPLMEVFAQVPDPRDPRGARHDLATVLTLAQTAVLAGARTLLAIAESTQDVARETLSRIGIGSDRTLPSESTIRRTLAQVDANDLDLLMSGWMATRVGDLAGRRVIAVDGKTMRGARTPAGAPHLVAAFDHAAGAVVGQLAVATKSNEFPALRDLLDGMDITDAVITADAMAPHQRVIRPFAALFPLDQAGVGQDLQVVGSGTKTGSSMTRLVRASTACGPSVKTSAAGSKPSSVNCFRPGASRDRAQGTARSAVRSVRLREERRQVPDGRRAHAQGGRRLDHRRFGGARPGAAINGLSA